PSALGRRAAPVLGVDARSLARVDRFGAERLAGHLTQAGQRQRSAGTWQAPHVARAAVAAGLSRSRPASRRGPRYDRALRGRQSRSRRSGSIGRSIFVLGRALARRNLGKPRMSIPALWE